MTKVDNCFGASQNTKGDIILGRKNISLGQVVWSMEIFKANAFTFLSNC